MEPHKPLACSGSGRFKHSRDKISKCRAANAICLRGPAGQHARRHHIWTMGNQVGAGTHSPDWLPMRYSARILSQQCNKVGATGGRGTTLAGLFM